MIKINLKQREYTFFVAFSLHAVAVVVAYYALIWKETVTDREIRYAKYGEYELYSSD